MTQISVRLNKEGNVRLAISTASDLSSPTYTDSQTTSGRVTKFDVTGLTADTQYYYGAEVDGVLNTSITGSFKTLGGTTLKVCIAGDASSGSTADAYNDILAEAPHFFIHLGDMHYEDITENSAGVYDMAFDRVFSSSTQGPLYRKIPTVYVWDDHDFCGNDSFGSATNKAAAQSAYRKRVPSHDLELGSGAIYHSFEVSVNGLGVVFIVTDQRSEASNCAATDNSSKSVLGTTQKTWFKNLLSDSGNSGKLFVWVCSRVWGGVATVGADHWGGFTTERTELANHFKTYCANRMLIVSADMHSLAIDSGANCDYATGTGAAIPTFQAAPLDRTDSQTYGGGTYSQGQFTNNGQYGILQFSKTGASQITVDMTGKRDTGATLVTYQKIFNL